MRLMWSGGKAVDGDGAAHVERGKGGRGIGVREITRRGVREGKR